MPRDPVMYRQQCVLSQATVPAALAIMDIFMAGMSFGPALGPSLGGYLVEHLSWRAVFYIKLPIGLVALVGSVLVTLPEGERRQNEELDLLGLVTMTTWVVSLLMAVSQARLYGW